MRFCRDKNLLITTQFEPIFKQLLLAIDLFLLLEKELLVDAVKVEVKVKLDDRNETEVKRADREQPDRAVEENFVREVD